MQLPATVLPEEIPGAPILLRILDRRERIEHRDDLRADIVDARDGDDGDEVIAADVSDEPLFAAHPPDHVMQNPGKQPDDAVALVIAVAIVELLEVIEVGIADGE